MTCGIGGCAYLGTSQGDLMIHRASHTNTRLFKCSFDGCDYVSLYRGHFLRHQNVHKSKKPHKCSTLPCTMAFATRGELEDHRKVCRHRPQAVVVREQGGSVAGGGLLAPMAPAPAGGLWMPHSSPLPVPPMAAAAAGAVPPARGAFFSSPVVTPALAPPPPALVGVAGTVQGLPTAALQQGYDGRPTGWGSILRPEVAVGSRPPRPSLLPPTPMSAAGAAPPPLPPPMAMPTGAVGSGGAPYQLYTWGTGVPPPGSMLPPR